MAQCSTCGSTVPESAAVCPDCGMDLKSANTPAVEASPAVRPTPGPSPQPAPAPVQDSGASQAQTSTGSARLTLRRGGALSQEVFSLGSGPSTIGRFDPETGPVDVDLGPLPEAVYISRRHAEIWCDGSGQWFVKDLGSGNATFVCAAGERQFRKTTGEHPIKDGDEIALGNARLEFRVH
jgi:pSer/pThr/pTyr-binding forkhead associated (FHA) protein